MNFNKTIAKDHSLNAMVGSSFEVSNQLEYNIAGSFFLSEDIHYMNLETEEKEWRKKESVRELQQKRNWN